MPADGHGRGRLSTISPILSVEGNRALPRNVVVLDAAMRRIVPRCLQPVKCLVTNCRTGLLPLWHIQIGRAEHMLGSGKKRKVLEKQPFAAIIRLLHALEPTFNEIETVFAPEHFVADKESRSAENSARNRSIGNRGELLANRS